MHDRVHAGWHDETGRWPECSERGLTHASNSGYSALIAKREDGKFVLATPHEIITVTDTEEAARTAAALILNLES